MIKIRYSFVFAFALLFAAMQVNAKTKTKGASTLPKATVTYENFLSKISNHEFYISNYGLYGQAPSGGTAGWYWPRQSNRAYIYGASIWFGARKRVADTLSPIVTIGYNPNSGASWFIPGSVDDGLNGLDDGDPRSAKYFLYKSVDYNQLGKNVTNSNKADWPIRWKDLNRTPGKDGYFGEYISDPAERSLYQPVFISQEDFFAKYKDTDNSRNPEYKPNNGHPLGIEVEQTTYSWGFGAYKDFVFFVYNVINKSSDTLRDCYLAPAMDPDIGDAANDHNSYYFKDSTLNLAFQYTENEFGYPGVLGFDFLESPKIKDAQDSANYRNLTGRVRNVGQQLGLTTFRNWTIDIDPSGDKARYDFMAANVRDGDNSPGDKRLLLATGPFTMRPGDTARVVVSLMIAPGIGNPLNGTETTAYLDSLVSLDKFAQTVYDNNFAAPKPPVPAVASARGIDRGVIVQWDETSEGSIDTLSGGRDFYGYRVYRSRSGKEPWKLLLDTNLATIPNGVAVKDWMPHSYTDVEKDSLTNNLEYYYWVASYDEGDPLANILPLENTPVANVNVVKVSPVGPSAGNDSKLGTFTANKNVGSFRNFRIETTNQARFNQLFSNHPLKVTLEPLNNSTAYTVQVTIADTVGKYESKYTITPGLAIIPNRLTDTTITFVHRSAELFGSFKFVVDYSIIQRKDAFAYDTTLVTTGDANTSTIRMAGATPNQNFGEATFAIDFLPGGTERIGLAAGDSADVPYLLLRVTNTTTGEVWDTTKTGNVVAPYGKWYLTSALWKSTAGVRQSRRTFIAGNRYYLTKPYGVADTVIGVHNFSILGNRIAIDPYSLRRLSGVANAWPAVPIATNDFEAGDRVTMTFKGGIAGTAGAAAFPSPGAVIKTTASNSTPAKYTAEILKQIKVVPNPYFVGHIGQKTTDDPKLYFNYLPPVCKIRIFNVAGDLIKTINHNGGSQAIWDILSDGRQKVASQLLIAHIETPDGTSQFIKFSVIVGGFRSIR